MKKIILLFILLCSLLLQGCWDKTELEDYGYVAVIGVDKGKNNMLRVTFQITNPQVGTSSRTMVNEPASEIITVPAADIMTAREIANISVTRKITFTHAKAIIISEELAMQDNFYQLLEGVFRDKDIRNEISMIVTKESAEEFINNNKPPMETRPNKFYTFMQNVGKNQD